MISILYHKNKINKSKYLKNLKSKKNLNYKKLLLKNCY
jgi:hypothetical protein